MKPYTPYLHIKHKIIANICCVKRVLFSKQNKQRIKLTKICPN